MIRVATISVLSIIALAAFLVLISPQRSAGQTDQERIVGYLWSETIGWISADCSTGGNCAAVDYGFVLDSAGTLSGFGWSENIGWVSARAQDVAGCPEAPCQPRVFDQELKGWLRVLSGGTAESGGWDGWISLSGTTGEGGAYGIKIREDGTFKDCLTDASCAWSDVAVGWIDFSRAYIGQRVKKLACTLAAAPTMVGPGDSFSLSYTTAEAESASIDRGVGTLTLPSGSKTITAPQTAGTYAYTLTATGADDKVVQCTAKVTVKVTDPPKCEPEEPVCINHKWCERDEACVLHCYGECEIGGTPQVDIRVSPTLVRQKNTTRVMWTTKNVTRCEVTENNPDFVDMWNTRNSTGETSSGITRRTVYTLQCRDGAGRTHTDSATVNVIPTFDEQ